MKFRVRHSILLLQAIAIAACCGATARLSANTVQFEPNAYSIAEDAPSSSVTLTVTARRTDPSAVITVQYSSTDGSATAGAASDYTSASGTLTFNANETQKQIVVQINNDSLAENAEDFTVSLFAPSNASLGRVNSNTGPAAVVAIGDDDSGTSTVQFSSSSYAVNEGNGAATITIVRSGGLDAASTVSVQTFDQSAQAGSDYVGRSGPVTFAPGVVAQTVDVTINDDRFLESSEQFRLSLSQPSENTTLGPRANAVVVIEDNDPETTVRFAQSNYTVSEATGAQVTLTVTLQRSAGSDGEVTVDFATRAGTALTGQDFDPVAGTLVFKAGESHKDISVPIVNDQVVEQGETFFVDLSNPSNASLLSESATASVTIQDDDASIFRFSAASYSASEVQGSGSLIIERSGSTALTVIVDYQTSNGTAQAGLDYVAESGSVVFAPEETSKTIDISIIDDTAAEGTENFQVALSTSDPNASLGSPSTAQFNILDDEGGTTPVITSPSSASGVQGQPFSYQIQATNNPTSYDATGLPAGLFVNRATGVISGNPSASGSFNVMLTATNSNGNGPTATLALTIAPPAEASPTPSPTASPSASPSPTASPGSPNAALANVSTRAQSGTGDNVLIGGVIIQGSGSKRIIMRAIGPSLAGVGVAGSLADPTLELFDGSGTSIAFNDDWKTGGQRAEIEQTGVPPGNEQESAIVADVAPGNYTAVVRGSNGKSGVALVEVYDLGGSGSQLANISTRSRVSIGDDVMIGGFIIGSDEPTRVMVRGIGPSLGQSTPPVANALTDPSLELRDGEGSLITSNDNWVNSPQRQQIEQTGLAPSDGRESAIIAALPKGTYTAIVRSSDGAAGVALVEVYRLSP